MLNLVEGAGSSIIMSEEQIFNFCPESYMRPGSESQQSKKSRKRLICLIVMEAALSIYKSLGASFRAMDMKQTVSLLFSFNRLDCEFVSR
jgi:hypothetical protein